MNAFIKNIFKICLALRFMSLWEIGNSVPPSKVLVYNIVKKGMAGEQVGVCQVVGALWKDHRVFLWNINHLQHHLGW